MFISGPTCNRSTQYTSHILSLPSNKLTYSPRRQNGLQTTNIFTKTLVQTKDGDVWAINQYKGCLCGPATNMDERCTVGMSANSLHRQFVSTLARPASLSSPAKENGPISPRGPTGLFILHFNNFTKTCQQLTNLSGEELQRSSNLKTRLLYAIPTWIGKTAGEKLKN